VNLANDLPFFERLTLSKIKKTVGMTLVELLIVIAVVGVLASVAWPTYQGYVSSSRESAMLQVMQSVKIYEEDRRVRLGEYVEGAYDPSNPLVSGGLATTLGWNPTDPDPDISILAACATDGSAPECARGSAIEITATHTQGESICRSYNGSNTSDC
jgi:prepilin-type N-terminal cleavage/methylation domain-containing protein